jgi:hypothetical protein
MLLTDKYEVLYYFIGQKCLFFLDLLYFLFNLLAYSINVILGLVNSFIIPTIS